jgi:hypothetical protein
MLSALFESSEPVQNPTFQGNNLELPLRRFVRLCAVARIVFTGLIEDFLGRIPDGNAVAFAICPESCGYPGPIAAGDYNSIGTFEGVTSLRVEVIVVFALAHKS